MVKLKEVSGGISIGHGFAGIEMFNRSEKIGMPGTRYCNIL